MSDTARKAAAWDFIASQQDVPGATLDDYRDAAWAYALDTNLDEDEEDEPSAFEKDVSLSAVEEFLTASARADLEAIQERASAADDEDLKYFGEHE